jgi:hypothetical protein
MCLSENHLKSLPYPTMLLSARFVPTGQSENPGTCDKATVILSAALMGGLLIRCMAIPDIPGPRA